jgi:hypothetical protein
MVAVVVAVADQDWPVKTKINSRPHTVARV